MKMYRKNLTIEMAKDRPLTVDKLVGMIMAITKIEYDIEITEVNKFNKVYLTVKASIFEYWLIKRKIEKRYPGVCKYYY